MMQRKAVIKQEIAAMQEAVEKEMDDLEPLITGKWLVLNILTCIELGPTATFGLVLRFFLVYKSFICATELKICVTEAITPALILENHFST